MIRVSSIFSQMLQLFSRHEFEQAVAEHRAERHARGFTCWGQFVAMLFCHLGRAQSLREICGGLAASEGKLRHLGLPDAPKRSTLAYANEHRPWQLYRAVFYQLLGRCREAGRTRMASASRTSCSSLDATLIELCATVFDWAQYRRTKGAVKLHLLLDHQGLLPSFALITEGRVHESRVARTLRFEPGTIVVFDRGYTDYDWFAALDADGVYFVTRMKDNADYGVVERRPVPERGPVQRDEIIFLYKLARERRTRSVPAPHRGLGRRAATHPGVSHQSSPLRRLHRRRYLPSALADRAVLQGAETEPAHQDLRRHQRQRPADSDLDRADRPAPAQVPATACPLRLEPVQSRRPAAPATVRLSRPVRLDRSTLSTPAPTRSPRRANPAFLVTQLGQQNGNLNLGATTEKPENAPIPLLPLLNPG